MLLKSHRNNKNAQVSHSASLQSPGHHNKKIVSSIRMHYPPFGEGDQGGYKSMVERGGWGGGITI